MKNEIITKIEASPVIAAVKNDGQLRRCVQSQCDVVFLLYGDILTLAAQVDEVKAAGKAAIVHIDLISGLAPREIAVDFIKGSTCADGIISTHPQLCRRAREVGLFTVLRVFAIDSMAVGNIERQCLQAEPDCIEVLPGVMPKVIARICRIAAAPIIAGGLILDKEDVLAALNAGAAGISTTNEEAWGY